MTMRTKHVLTTLSLSLMLLSFTPPSSPAAHNVRTGTYGVCGCLPAAASGPAISLTLDEVGSFRYVNSTNPAKPIDVTGRWEMAKGKVTLRSASGEVFGTWSMDKDTNCLRSRKGLLFTRLCHLEVCQ